jgi:hypothetical protein
MSTPESERVGKLLDRVVRGRDQVDHAHRSLTVSFSERIDKRLEGLGGGLKSVSPSFACDQAGTLEQLEVDVDQRGGRAKLASDLVRKPLALGGLLQKQEDLEPPD